jgi:hypothetical protein
MQAAASIENVSAALHQISKLHEYTVASAVEGLEVSVVR